MRFKLSEIIIGFIDFMLMLYQMLISPLKLFLFGSQSSCRFYPSCSSFTRQALIEFGLLKGIYISFKRLLRCHPWNEGGIDPVSNHNQSGKSIQINNCKCPKHNH